MSIQLQTSEVGERLNEPVRYHVDNDHFRRTQISRIKNQGSVASKWSEVILVGLRGVV